jgi:AcrR family transcriptional regulator
MPRSRREKIRDITRAEIKETARQLMAEKGTAGISLRAIARRMGMTAPALYHYYAGLNDLITALIQDAFTQLADTLEMAAAEQAHATYAARLVAVALANRRWALDHPVDFQLIYGNPIPQYEQPTDITYPPARRSFLVTARLFTAAIANGELELPPAYKQLPAGITDSLRQLTTVEGHDLPLPALYLAAIAWTRIHGHVMLELFNLIQPVISDVEVYFQYEVQVFLQQVGFQISDKEKQK